MILLASGMCNDNDAKETLIWTIKIKWLKHESGNIELKGHLHFG